MSTVIVNDAMRQQLLAAATEFEFRDENGNLITRCRKLTDPRQFALPPGWPSDEELDRIAREDKGRYTPEQVMARLQELTKCS